jgi:hypothetical protein
MRGSQQVTSEPEQVLDHGVDRGEPLQAGRRLEVPHLAFALPGRLMRHLDPVVGVLIRTMHDGRHDRPMCRGVAPELVRDQAAGKPAVSLQECAEEPSRGAPIPSCLHEDVEYFAVLGPRPARGTIGVH